jgi:hypothetical protein
MDGLKFYYLTNFPYDNVKFPNMSLSNDFPGINQAIANSKEYSTYKQCAQHCVDFLKGKLEILNAGTDIKYKIFFEKNQFDSEELSFSKFEPTEVVKIYIADSTQSIYNSVFKARIFFTKDIDASYFDAVTTLQ